MELFKYHWEDATQFLELESGEIINDLTSIVWTERYAQPGEFEIKSPLSSNIRNTLPIGTLISHIDTAEVMMVENHEIREQPDEEPIVVVTGRSLDALLEFRIVGNQDCRSALVPYVSEYVLGIENFPWQVVSLINDNINGHSNSDDGYALLLAATLFPYTPTDDTLLPITKTDLLRAVSDLLAIQDLGLKVIRRNWWNRPDLGLGVEIYNLLMVHAGQDRTDKVIFSWKSGDLTEVNYLFSNRLHRNTAMVVGRWVWVMVDTEWPGTNYDYMRRQMLVDANDIDSQFQEPPIDAEYTAVRNKMIARGNQILRGNNNLVLGQSDVSNVTKYKYRKDYDIGDLVTLDANFGQIAVVRIIEHTEIEDETGESSHPTLSLPYSTSVTTRPTLGGFIEVTPRTEVE